MSGLLTRIEKTIRERRLLEPNQAVLVAVSGGVDSMVLLDVLHRLDLELVLHIAHLNHRLRDASSDADEKLVRRAAASLCVPVSVERRDVRTFARKEKISIEMAARQLRHEFLARLAGKHKIRSIALAHHADDQVELFFLRLLRGASVEGLGGMEWSSPSPADPQLTLVRPLLDCPKQELLEYARSHKTRFREDRTNRNPNILRNRIRHELIPLLQKHYQPAVQTTTLRLMEILRAESQFIALQSSQNPAHACMSGGTIRDPQSAKSSSLSPGERAGVRGKSASESHPTSDPQTPPSSNPQSAIGNPQSLKFGSLHLALQRRLIQKQLIELGLEPNFDLIEQLRRSEQIPVMVQPNIVVTRDASGCINLHHLSPASLGSRGRSPSQQLAVSLTQPNGAVSFGGVEIRWSLSAPAGLLPLRLDRREGRGEVSILLDRQSAIRNPQLKHGVESFDADKIGASIVLRHWQPGDRFQPIGMPKPVKLQDLFVNQKVLRPNRHKLLIAATAAGAIVWVEGLRISECFKLDKVSRRRLKLSWRRT